VLDLTALASAPIIGTGIFVVIGEAIGDAGGRASSRFVLAGVTCAFSALAYASSAPQIPVAAARTRTPTRRWASSSRGSSAGT
jgi:APA family basic amino acid/polyamine antiporter